MLLKYFSKKDHLLRLITIRQNWSARSSSKSSNETRQFWDLLELTPAKVALLCKYRYEGPDWPAVVLSFLKTDVFLVIEIVIGTRSL